MEAKRSKKPLPTSKVVTEFVITILVAIALFLTVNSLGILGTFCRLCTQHDKIMLAAISLATALVLCSFRRWLEARRSRKVLTESEDQLRFQSTLLNEIGDGITATDFKGIITYLKQAQCNRDKRSRD